MVGPAAVVVVLSPIVVVVSGAAVVVVSGAAVVVVVLLLPQPAASTPTRATMSNTMAMGMMKRLLTPRRTMLAFLSFFSPEARHFTPSACCSPEPNSGLATSC